MHRSLVYLLLLGICVVLTSAQTKKPQKCPVGERWLDEGKICSIIGQIISGVQKTCESGYIPFMKACAKPGEKAIECPEGQVYNEKDKRCAALLVEETKTEEI